MVVLSIDEFIPWLARLRANEIVIVVVQCETILVNISEKIIRSQNFSNLHKLIVIVAALEEWFLLEDHSSEHATK